MCDACKAEYSSPLGRRFHAQPIACTSCGPKLWLERSDGRNLDVVPQQEALDYACTLLQQGNIIAIKGIDGFLGPGHVSMIIGQSPYLFIADQYKKPLVIAGFEPLDNLQSIWMILNQMKENRHEIENQYGAESGL